MTIHHGNHITDPPDASLGRDRIRTLTQQFEAGFNDLATMFTAQRERLDVAIACDAQQAAELEQVRICFHRILAGESPSGWARTGLNYLSRAEQRDVIRDEHISIVSQLVGIAHQLVRAMAGAIERLLVGRSRREETP